MSGFVKHFGQIRTLATTGEGKKGQKNWVKTSPGPYNAANITEGY